MWNIQMQQYYVKQVTLKGWSHTREGEGKTKEIKKVNMVNLLPTRE
jgi:hypothetical protein